MTSGNRCVRNRRLRLELKSILEAIPEGDRFTAADIVQKFKGKTRDITSRTIGCLLRDYDPDLVSSLGQGVWLRAGGI